MLFQSWLYSLINTFEGLRLGEDSFPKIQSMLQTYLSKYQIQFAGTLENLEYFDSESNKFTEPVKLSDLFAFAKYYKDIKTLEDTEWCFSYGDVPTPSEYKVTRIVIDHANGLKNNFEHEMEPIFDRNGASHFSS